MLFVKKGKLFFFYDDVDDVIIILLYLLFDGALFQIQDHLEANGFCPEIGKKQENNMQNFIKSKRFHDVKGHKDIRS